MFNNLRDARAQIEKLTGECTALKTRAETAESNILVITSRAELAEGKVTELTTDLESSQNEVKTLTTRAEAAELKLKESEAKQADFDAKVKTAATAQAISQLAAVGHKPVEGDNSLGGGEGGGVSNTMSEDQFWSTYRSQKPSAKAEWYKANKHHIGR